MLLSMHYTKGIDDSTSIKQKPEIITAYNSTKSVDTLDWIAENYSVAIV